MEETRVEWNDVDTKTALEPPDESPHVRADRAELVERIARAVPEATLSPKLPTQAASLTPHT